MLRTGRKLRALATGVLLLNMMGCGAEEGPSTNATCTSGKCDGISASFKDLYSKMDRVDLGDLVLKGASLATDQVNDLLGDIPYGQIRLSETEVFGTKEQAARDLTIQNLDELRAGLAERYGDDAFVTRVNTLRTDYLRQNPGKVFAEAHFVLGAAGNPTWRYDVSELAEDATGWVGFSGEAQVETRVIAPVSSESKAAWQAPLAAVKAVRGFVVPRSVRDVLAMAPGEILAMRGHGRVGFNVGLGVPLYLVEVSSYATLHAVFSAAARATLTGDLDIQLIRDQGTRAYVDVGLTGEAVRWMKLALSTRWGVEGLPEVNVAGFDLTRTAEKGLERLLDKRLKVLDASYSNEKRRVRHTISRFAFDLSREDVAVRQAMTQAMRGDIRLAQALANRQESGVTQVLDLTRDSRSLSSFLGVSFLGMKFYRDKADREGAVVVTTDGESQNLLFNEIARESGFFFVDRSYKRLSVVSLKSKEGKLVDADYNLRVTLRENDKFTSRDQVLDHVDNVLALFTGHQKLQEQLAQFSDQLENYVDSACDNPGPSADYDADRAFRDCLKNVGNQARAQTLRQAAEQATEGMIASGIKGGFDAEHDDAAKFVRTLATMRITAQGSPEYPAAFTGPKGRMTVEYRLTAAALDGLLSRTDGRSKFEQHLRETLYTLYLERGAQLSKRTEWVDQKMAAAKKQIKEMGQVFEDAASRYRQMVTIAHVNHMARDLGATTVGNKGHLVMVDRRGGVALETVAERKAELAAELFDALVGAADGLYKADHQVVGYALLRAVDPAQLELLVNFSIDDDDNWLKVPSAHLYGRGRDAKLIDAGQFDLDALLN